MLRTVRKPSSVKTAGRVLDPRTSDHQIKVHWNVFNAYTGNISHFVFICVTWAHKLVQNLSNKTVTVLYLDLWTSGHSSADAYESLLDIISQNNQQTLRTKSK